MNPIEVTPRDPEARNRVCIRAAFDSIKQDLGSALIPEVLSLKPGESVTFTIRRAGETSWGDYVEITSP